MTKPISYEDSFRRGMLRTVFHSLFWSIILDRKKRTGMKMKDLADTLGVNKSFVSRSFSSPPNWRIDTLADFSEALDVDLVIEARDRRTGRVFTPSGVILTSSTTTSGGPETIDRLGAATKTDIIKQPIVSSSSL